MHTMLSHVVAQTSCNCAGGLIGGVVGAAVGTLMNPGLGTAAGYLIGIEAGRKKASDLYSSKYR